MRSFRLPILCSLLLATALVGCDTTATQPTDSQVFVESYQQAGAPLDTVWLTRTAGARETIDPSEAAVENAAVEIENLDTDNITSYTEASAPGAYVPDREPPPTVETQTSYRLRIETDDGETVTSTTTVPDAFTLEDVEDTPAVFQDSTRQPSFILDPPNAESQPYEQDRQNVYFFTVTETNELDPRNLTPFYRDSYDADEDSIESFRVNSSPLLNQANFSLRGDRVSVDLPWIGVAFFGEGTESTVGINLVGDNYYDFLRSESAQESAPPGEFPNIIDHVENGTGIFASYVREDTTLTIECRERFLQGNGGLRCPGSGGMGTSVTSHD